MNRIFFSFVVLILALATSCNNQSNNSKNSPSLFGRDNGRGAGNFDPEAIANRQVEQMKETLNLNSDQEKQMHDIMMQSFENMRKVREQLQSDGGGFEGMREEMQKMREEQNKKIKSILSDEQWGKYQKYQEEMRSRRRQGGFGGQGRQN